jgi:hypothetical protein
LQIIRRNALDHPTRSVPARAKVIAEGAAQYEINRLAWSDSMRLCRVSKRSPANIHRPRDCRHIIIARNGHALGVRTFGEFQVPYSTGFWSYLHRF